MSSRALKRAQKQKEEKERAQAEDGEHQDDDEDDGIIALTTQKSAFEMLADAQSDDGASSEEQESESGTPPVSSSQKNPERTVSRPKPKSKHKKRKKKSSGAEDESHESRNDDIDEVLNSLSIDNRQHGLSDSQDYHDEFRFQHLNLEPQHLHVENEMRRLFGRSVLKAENQDETRPRRAPGEMLTIPDAVSGLYSPYGMGLPAIVRKRNIFSHGSDQWPKSTSGGLGMEVEESQVHGVEKFRFTHNKAYQLVQGEFEASILTTEPQVMVGLLRENPYHVGFLLQVSEICKHQGDHSPAEELLERALFSFGRSAHSRFSSALFQGKARLDFRRPENREFWLSARKYLETLGLRGTWRTAFEWAKMILGLDESTDPHGMKLIIDQLALRSRQLEYLENVTKDQGPLANDSTCMPNLQFSRALAARLASSRSPDIGPERSKTLLIEAILAFPWVATRLFQELGIERIPATIWGREAPNPRQKLLCEHYVTTAVDLWRTAEAKEFLISQASQVDDKQIEAGMRHLEPEVTESEARHVIVSEKRQLIALLPQSLTSRIQYAIDPLPPRDDVRSYRSYIHGNGHERSTELQEMLERGSAE